MALLHLLPRNKLILPSINVVFTRAPKDPQLVFLQRKHQALTTLCLCHIQWDTKTDVSTLQMDNELLHYLYNKFGPMVHFCTEYKHDICTFQCHPNYGSAGTIHDWMIIKFNTGLVLDDSTSVKEVHLVVQSKQHLLW